MSLKDIKDKLDVGLKPDAPYRPNNLPATELGEEEVARERARERRGGQDETPPHGDPLRPHTDDRDS
jgi:hypothetical protein